VISVVAMVFTGATDNATKALERARSAWPRTRRRARPRRAERGGAALQKGWALFGGMHYTFRGTMTTAPEASPAPVQIFVQARMSSRRFPGKVLAPLDGRPVIRHVVEAVSRALPALPMVVATTLDEADDPLVAYLDGLGVRTFRGDRDDVFGRFRACLAKHPAEWILRVCGDSPRLDPRVLRAVAARAAGGAVDVVTTRLPVPLAKGQNAELIRAGAFLAVDARELSAADREHVMPYFYRHPERFRILGVADVVPDLVQGSFVVDDVDDLRRLEHPAGVG